MANDLRIEINTTANTAEAEAKLNSLINKYKNAQVNLNVGMKESLSSSSKGSSSSKESSKISLEQKLVNQGIDQAIKGMIKLNAQEAAYGNLIAKNSRAYDSIMKAKVASAKLLSNTDETSNMTMLKDIELTIDAAKNAQRELNELKKLQSGGGDTTPSHEQKLVNQGIDEAIKGMIKLNAEEAAYGELIKNNAKASEALSNAKQATAKLLGNSETTDNQTMLRDIQLAVDAAKIAQKEITALKKVQSEPIKTTPTQEQKFINQGIEQAIKSMVKLNAEEAAYGELIRSNAKAADAVTSAKQATAKLLSNTETTDTKTMLRDVQIAVDAAKAAQKEIDALKKLQSTPTQTPLSQDQKQVNKGIEQAINSMIKLNAQEAAYGELIRSNTQAADAFAKARDANTNVINNKDSTDTKAMLRDIQLATEAAKVAQKEFNTLMSLQGSSGTTSSEKLYSDLIANQRLYQEQINGSAKATEELNRAFAAYSNIDKSKNNVVEHTVALREFEIAGKQALKTITGFQAADIGALTKARQSLDSYLMKNPRYTQDENIVGQVSNINSLLDQGTLNSLKEANVETAKLKMSMKQLGLEGETAFGKMKSKFKDFTSWFSISQLVMTAIRTFKQMVNNVVELDSSLVELAKVSDMTSGSFDKFVKDAFAAGETLARTGKEVIDATTVFKRAGYDMTESLDLAQSALLLTNVGDGIKDVESAASSMIAILRGFDMDFSQSEHIVDMINEVSNTAPIDAENITDGLTRTAALLAQSGTSIEETIGMLTGGFARLRNMEWVSTGLNMISQRIRSIGEDGEAIDGLGPKIESEFKRIAGIKITDNGSLRSTYDIMSDMAEIFPQMMAEGKDIQVQYLTELAAGKRQARNLTAIIAGWDDVQKAIESANNAEGSAAKENAKYMDSIQGKLNNLQSSWQALSATLVSSDFLKGAIDGVRLFIDLLDTLAGSLGTFPVLMAGLSGVLTGLGKKGGIFEPLQMIASGGASPFSKIGRLDSTKNLTKNINDYNTALNKSLLTLDEVEARKIAYAAVESNLSKSQENYFSKIKEGEATQAGFAASVEASGKSMAVATAQSVALNAGLTLLATVAINYLANKLNELVFANEIAIEKAAELREEYQNTMSALKGNTITLEGMEDEFNRLAQGVSAYGQNISLSSEEYARYLEIVNQVANISPSLVQGYDNEGNAIINKNNLIQDSIDLLKEQQDAERRQYLSTSNFEALVNAAKGELSIAQNNFRDFKTGYSKLAKDLFNEMNNISKDYAKDMFGFDISSASIFEAITSKDQLGTIDKILKANADVHGKYFNQLTDDMVLGLETYRAEYAMQMQDISNAAKSLNPDLQSVPELSKYYESLTNEAKSFIGHFINAFKLPEDVFEYEEAANAFKVSIVKFTDAIGKDKTLQDMIYDFMTIDQNALPIGELRTIIDSLFNYIAENLDLTEEEIIELKVGLKIAIRDEENPNEIKDRIDELYKNIREQWGEYSFPDEVLEKFSIQELNILLDPKFEFVDPANFANDVEGWIIASLSKFQVDTQIELRKVEFGATVDKVNLLTNALKEQTRQGKISDETFRILYNANEEYRDLLKVVGNDTTLLTAETRDYIEALIDTAYQEAILAGATQEEKDAIDALRSSIEETTNSFQAFEDALELGEITDGAFTSANKAIQAIEDGMKSGETETEKFHTAMKLLFGDTPPKNLNNAITDLKLLFSDDEKDIEKFFKLINDHLGEGGISLSKLQEDFGLSDEGIGAVYDRLNELGLLYAIGEKSVMKLGNGLGLMSVKAVDLESNLGYLIKAFEDGDAGLEDTYDGLEKLIKQYGITGDAADTLRKNFKYMVEGLNEDTRGAFAGISADDYTKITPETQSSIKQFIDQDLKWITNAVEDAVAQNKLEELDIVDQEQLKFNLERQLKELGFVDEEITRIVEQLLMQDYRERVGIKLEAYFEEVDISEDEKNAIIEKIDEAILPDGTLNVDAAINGIITLHLDSLTQEDQGSIRQLMQDYIDGEIDKTEFTAQIKNLNLGNIESTVLTAADAMLGVLGNTQKAGSEALTAAGEFNSLSEAVNNAKEAIATLGQQSLSGISSSANNLRSTFQGIIGLARILAAMTIAPKVVMPSTTTTTTKKKTTSKTPMGQVKAQASGGVSDGGNTIVGDEFVGAYEMVLDIHGNTQVYGKDGAELIRLNKGDIVYPHSVTRDILSGKIKMYASGSGAPSSTGYDPSPSSSSKSSKKKKSAAQTKAQKEEIKKQSEELKDQIEEAFALLKHQLEMDMITEAQYYKKLKEYNDKYYKGKSEYLKEYRSNLEELYDYQKSRDEDLIKAQFDNLEFKRDMGKIDEAGYYKELKRLNDTYYKGKEDKLDDYRSNLKSLYDYQKQKDQEAIDGKFDNLSHLLNMNYISEATYYQRLREYNDKYYRGKEEYLSEYRSNLEALYNWEKEQERERINANISMYELIRELAEEDSPEYEKYTKQLHDLQAQMQAEIAKELAHYRALGYKEDSAVLVRLKQEWYEIEKWKREEIKKTKEVEIKDDISDREAVISAVVRRLNREIEELEKRRDMLADESIIGSYGHRIKLINDEIDALKKRNDELDRELELQKAKDNLERLRNQRTLLIYRDGIGFVYEVDTKAIEEAEQSIKDLELDIYIDNLEKQKDNLEDILEREQEALNETIKEWEEYRDKWDSIVSDYKESQEDLMAIQYLGADWEAQILKFRLDILEEFKNAYIAKMEELAAAAEEIVEELPPITPPPTDSDPVIFVPELDQQLNGSQIITQPIGGNKNKYPTSDKWKNQYGSNSNSNLASMVSDLVQVQTLSTKSLNDIASNVTDIMSRQSTVASDANKSTVEIIPRSNNIDVSIGDINLNEIQNANELAKHLVANLPNAVTQAIYKG